jgi:hypothetical protein
MTSFLKENYKPEELETERQLCSSLFDIPHPNEITGIKQIIDYIKDFEFLSYNRVPIDFIIVGIDGKIIIECNINDISDKLFFLENKYYKLVYKDKSYITLYSLLTDLDFNDNTHNLTLVKNMSDYFKYFSFLYLENGHKYNFVYIIKLKYYYEKYNIKFIEYFVKDIQSSIDDNDTDDNDTYNDTYYYPVVMIPTFLEDCIEENSNTNYLLHLKIPN